MFEYDQNKSENPADESGTLGRLQNDSRESVKPKPYSSAVDSKLNNIKIQESPKYKDDFAAEKTAELIRETRKTDLIFLRMLTAGELISDIDNTAIEMAKEKIARTKIPNYDKLSAKEKTEKKENLFKNLESKEQENLISKTKLDIFANNGRELLEKTKNNFSEKVQTEIRQREFGECSRKYTVIILMK